MDPKNQNDDTGVDGSKARKGFGTMTSNLFLEEKESKDVDDKNKEEEKKKEEEEEEEK